MLRYSARSRGARRKHERPRRSRVGRRVAHPVSGLQRFRHYRRMGGMVVEAADFMRFRLDLRFARPLTRDTGAPSLCFGNRGGGGKLGLYRPDSAQTFSRALNEARLNDYLPCLWPSISRDDANGRLPVLLRMQGLRCAVQAQGGGLLRILFLWRCAVSADTGRETAWPRRRMLLRRVEQAINRIIRIYGTPRGSRADANVSVRSWRPKADNPLNTLTWLPERNWNYFSCAHRRWRPRLSAKVVDREERPAGRSQAQ